ncbi:MAG: ABC transporter permease [Verrucomicrobiales bacterium]|jgi:spermidine/putrescine transport system permease protein|nr:ABC transporter permease [Verrucomicrobiales bacterium]
MKRSSAPAWTTVLVIVFFYIPTLTLIIQSFNSAKYGGGWQGFTLDWYRKLMHEREVWRAVQNSLWIAAYSTLGATTLGTLGAWMLNRYKSKLQSAHYTLMYAPLMVPEILMGISLLMFFVNLGIPLGLPTIILAHITFCVSYVCFTVMGRLQDFDDSLIHAAQDLGAQWPTIIWKILLPLLGPGILAGALLAFTLSIDDFVITFFTSGPGSTTLPVYIYSAIKKGSLATINALSVLMMLVTFTIVLVSNHFINHKKT